MAAKTGKKAATRWPPLARPADYPRPVEHARYKRARRTARFYLLYYGRNHYTVIPRRVFADAQGRLHGLDAFKRRCAETGTGP